MELHIGSEIRRVLEEKGITPEWLANKISTSRRNVYDILKRSDISTGQLTEISQALEYDFFGLYQPTTVNEDDLMYETVKRRKSVMVSVELDGLQTTLDQWFDTLKKINSALT